jgi:hypothetical protein
MPGWDGLQWQITGPNFIKFGLFVQVVEVETHVHSVVISRVKLTPWCPILLQQILSTYSACYTTWRFITLFTDTPHQSPSSARQIQSTSFKPTSCRSTLILYFHLSLYLQSGIFPLGFHPKCGLRIMSLPRMLNNQHTTSSFLLSS